MGGFVFCGMDIPLAPFEGEFAAVGIYGVGCAGEWSGAFCEKWGAKFDIVLFIVCCLIVDRVVFGVDGCAPCTPKLSAGRIGERGVYFEMRDEKCYGFLHGLFLNWGCCFVVIVVRCGVLRIMGMPVIVDLGS